LDTPIDQQLKSLRGLASVRWDLQASNINASIDVLDSIQAPITVNPETDLGTPVLWRKDGYVSYLLATSVDDSDGITDVVRGADLWPETPAQHLLMQQLERVPPRWTHVPIAIDDEGLKLGKQTRARSIHEDDPLPLLQKVWRFLGQSPMVCGSLDDFWEKAADQWSLSAVPKVAAQRID